MSNEEKTTFMDEEELEEFVKAVEELSKHDDGGVPPLELVIKQ